MIRNDLEDVLVANIHTGEMVNIKVKKDKQPPSPFKRHVTSNQDMIYWLLNNLKMEELRLYMALTAELDMKNFIHVSQKSIAEKLGMLQPNISRAMKRLISMNIVELAPTTIKAYKLSPDYVWKGSVFDHIETLRVIKGGRE